MSEHVQVRHPELVTHSGAVAVIADRVDLAGRAGQAVRAGPAAYGKLCWMVPVMLGALQDVLVDGIASAADSLHGTSVRLRATAQDYACTDERRAKVFDQLRGGT